MFPRLSGLLFSVDWRTSIIDHTGERIILAVSWYVVVVCTPFINLPPPSLPDPPDLPDIRSCDPNPIYSTPIRYTTLIRMYWLSFGYEIWSDHAGIILCTYLFKNALTKAMKNTCCGLAIRCIAISENSLWEWPEICYNSIILNKSWNIKWLYKGKAKARLGSAVVRVMDSHSCVQPRQSHIYVMLWIVLSSYQMNLLPKWYYIYVNK